MIVGLLEANLPAIVDQIPAFNEKGPYYNPAVKSIFEWRGLHTSNPVTGITVNNTIDSLHLHATNGNARQAGEASSSSVKGRYYTEGIYTLIASNITNDDVEFTYIYSWHEFRIKAVNYGILNKSRI